MVSKKRSLENATSPKAKKSKLAAEGSPDKKQKKAKAKVKVDKPLEHTSNTVPDEIDFPRGGGTTFTPHEVKTIRAEALKEADDLFKVRMQCVIYVLPLMNCVKEHSQKTKRPRKKSDAKGKGIAVEGGGKKTNVIRIEHLNYKVCLRRQLSSPRVDYNPNSASP